MEKEKWLDRLLAQICVRNQPKKSLFRKSLLIAMHLIARDQTLSRRPHQSATGQQTVLHKAKQKRTFHWLFYFFWWRTKKENCSWWSVNEELIFVSEANWQSVVGTEQRTSWWGVLCAGPGAARKFVLIFVLFVFYSSQCFGSVAQWHL